MNITSASPEQIAHGDMDEDGSVSVSDAVVILRLAMGLVS
jgi:hypothetical protein